MVEEVTLESPTGKKTHMFGESEIHWGQEEWECSILKLFYWAH